MSYENALSSLRELLARLVSVSKDAGDKTLEAIIAAKEQVRARYVPVFTREKMKNLDEEEFRGFLLFKNNQHWGGLHRQSSSLTADVPRLREALTVLVDESVPIETRLNKLRPKVGDPMVKGLGRSIITAILQVVYPEKYGVLNNTAEAGMRKLGIWPKIPGSASFAERYKAVNEILIRLASDLGVDLWTLDSLWWRLTVSDAGNSERPVKDPGDTIIGEEKHTIPMTTPATEPMFGMERQLQEFLIDNWTKLEVGKDWNLLEEDGEITGSEYNTGEVGAIDLLARSKNHKRWLIIELKRGQSSDETVGQILRYMSWVRRNLAGAGEEVEGLVICRSIDKKMQYALDGLPNIRCMLYQVSFSLHSVPEFQVSKGTQSGHSSRG